MIVLFLRFVFVAGVLTGGAAWALPHPAITQTDPLNERDETETYDADGRLTAITNRQGMRTTLTYVDGDLREVRNQFNRTLTFTYTAPSKRPPSMTAASPTRFS